jgi:hypothetical protein
LASMLLLLVVVLQVHGTLSMGQDRLKGTSF